MTNQHTSLPMPDRFWSKADTTGGTYACWEWQARRLPSGYGQFWDGGKVVKAHRFAWELAQGVRLDPDTVVRHSCDNPPCVNPLHLMVGSHADNSHDRDARARNHNKTKTACVHGHPFDAANTRYDKDGHRACRACSNRRRYARWRRAREEVTK